MEIKIEKGIPVPKKGARIPRGEFAEAMKNMEVEDSFLVTLEEGQKMSTLQSKIRQTAKRHNINIVASQVGKNQLRVWRVANPENAA